jgi:hypothetical protein
MAKMNYIKYNWIIYFSVKIKDWNQRSNKNFTFQLLGANLLWKSGDTCILSCLHIQYSLIIISSFKCQQNEHKGEIAILHAYIEWSWSKCKYLNLSLLDNCKIKQSQLYIMIFCKKIIVVFMYFELMVWCVAKRSDCSVCLWYVS